MLKWTKHGQYKDSGDECLHNTSINCTDHSINANSCLKENNRDNANVDHKLISPCEDHRPHWNGEKHRNSGTGETNELLDYHRNRNSCSIHQHNREGSELCSTSCATVHCSFSSCFLVRTSSPPSPEYSNSKLSSNSSLKSSSIRPLNLQSLSLRKSFHTAETSDRQRRIENCDQLERIVPKDSLSASAYNSMASELPDITSMPPVNREILGPEVAWDEENLTLAQLLEKDCFPCVCCYEERVQESGGQWERLTPGLKIYSRQPVLTHTGLRQTQARARTIFKDPGGTYYEVGQTMIIPGDYQGWFELVPSDFSRASCFMSIAEVAKAMPKKLFTRSNVKAIRMEGEGESQNFLERKIPAGSVLEILGTFTAKWKTVAESGLLKKVTKEWELQQVTYLKCQTDDKCEILVPLNHRGKFNAIYEKGHLTQNSVYSMKDILSDLSLPVKVRLLFGKAPVVPCIFTGMLIIRSAQVVDSIVGCTILNTRNVLFEIPLSSPVKVKYVTDDQPFSEMNTYKDALKLCKKYAKVFSNMIKLAPDMDTGQKVILHVPNDPSLKRNIDESLRALDLITDISLSGEPRDLLLDSDTGSMDSSDQVVIPPPGASTEVTEYKGRESHTFV